MLNTFVISMSIISISVEIILYLSSTSYLKSILQWWSPTVHINALNALPVCSTSCTQQITSVSPKFSYYNLTVSFSKKKKKKKRLITPDTDQNITVTENALQRLVFNIPHEHHNTRQDAGVTLSIWGHINFIALILLLLSLFFFPRPLSFKCIVIEGISFGMKTFCPRETGSTVFSGMQPETTLFGRRNRYHPG